MYDSLLFLLLFFSFSSFFFFFLSFFLFFPSPCCDCCIVALSCDQLFEASHWSPGEFSMSTPTPFSPPAFGGVFSPSPTPKGKPMFDASKLKEDIKPMDSSDLEELDALSQSESRTLDFASPMAPKHQSKILTVKASVRCFVFCFVIVFVFRVESLPSLPHLQKIKTGSLETPLSPSNETEFEAPGSRRSAPGKIITEVSSSLSFFFFFFFSQPCCKLQFRLGEDLPIGSRTLRSSLSQASAKIGRAQETTPLEN